MTDAFAATTPSTARIAWLDVHIQKNVFVALKMRAAPSTARNISVAVWLRTKKTTNAAKLDAACKFRFTFNFARRLESLLCCVVLCCLVLLFFSPHTSPES